MPVRYDAWPAGTPCWIDLVVDDPVEAAGFYQRLFGWDVPDLRVGRPGGRHLVATSDGRPAAGIVRSPLRARAMPGRSGCWTTYLATADAARTAAAVRAAGGVVHGDPGRVGPAGRAFVATAPDGSVFGVWQSRRHLGMEVRDEAGTCAWSELHSRQLGTALQFYLAVFGYTYDDISGPDATYLVLSGADGCGVGGMTSAAMLPEGVPSVWLTWFAVVSCDDTVRRVEELGGAVLMAPGDSPFGRLAVVRGAQGEPFGVIGAAGEPTSGP